MIEQLNKDPYLYLGRASGWVVYMHTYSWMHASDGLACLHALAARTLHLTWLGEESGNGSM